MRFADKAFQIEIPGFEILEKLGQGNMSEVFSAMQLNMDRMVAIKVLSPKLSSQKEYSDQFISEAKLVAKLNHNNIIKGLAIGENKGLHYFVMEFIDGINLQDKLIIEGVFSEKLALEITLQIVDALKYIQQFGILHRDIKPANIILNYQNVPKLADLGLGITKNKLEASQNNIAGTPYYISPEQAQHNEVDFRSDLYSLGATLFHLITGRPPFEGANSLVVMTKHITEDLTPAKEINPNLSKGVSDLILKMMAKNADDRYQTCDELMNDIKVVLETGILPIKSRLSIKSQNKNLKKTRRFRGHSSKIRSNVVRRKSSRKIYIQDSDENEDISTAECIVNNSDLIPSPINCMEMLKQAIACEDLSLKEAFLLKAMSNQSKENDPIALEAKCRLGYLISKVRKKEAIQIFTEIAEDFKEYKENKFFKYSMKKHKELTGS